MFLFWALTAGAERGALLVEVDGEALRGAWRA